MLPNIPRHALKENASWLKYGVKGKQRCQMEEMISQKIVDAGILSWTMSRFLNKKFLMKSQGRDFKPCLRLCTKVDQTQRPGSGTKVS